MEKKPSTLIIGAGPAGLACALELVKSGKKIIVVEKDSKVGGLAKTILFKVNDMTFRTDIGPHRFFSKNPILYSFMSGILGEKWINVDRFTRFYVKGKFFLYPIKFFDALKGIGFFGGSKMAFDYLKEKMKRIVSKKEPKNFEEFIVQNFGQSLGEFNMLRYTEKIWGLPCSELSVEWGKQRIKGLNFFTAIKNSLLKSAKDPKTLVDRFYYPELGTGQTYEMIEQKIGEKNTVLLNIQPAKIRHDNKTILEVELKSEKAGKKKVSTKNMQVVSSVPITEFMELLDPKPPKKVIKAVKNLKYRSQVYLFLVINKDSVTKDQWIYFPDKKIPFGRVSEMKNFSKKMSPAGKTSLFVEFFCFEGDKTWQMEEKEIFECAMKYLEPMSFVKKEEVITYFVKKSTNVYPIYDINYKKHLSIAINFLNMFENLTTIGRPGLFKYTNQDHSIEMGLAAAKNIIEGKKIFDIEKIGTEEEYFEKGKFHDVNGKKTW